MIWNSPIYQALSSSRLLTTSSCFAGDVVTYIIKTDSVNEERIGYWLNNHVDNFEIF